LPAAAPQQQQQQQRPETPEIPRDSSPSAAALQAAAAIAAASARRPVAGRQSLGAVRRGTSDLEPGVLADLLAEGDAEEIVRRISTGDLFGG
jgi:hypothetical protein